MVMIFFPFFKQFNLFSVVNRHFRHLQMSNDFTNKYLERLLVAWVRFKNLFSLLLIFFWISFGEIIESFHSAPNAADGVRVLNTNKLGLLQTVFSIL